MTGFSRHIHSTANHPIRLRSNLLLSSTTNSNLAAVRSEASYTMATLDHDRRNKQPRLLTEAERDKLEEFVDAIHYSSRSDVGCIWDRFGYADYYARYSDDENEYRHVQLPKDMIKKIPKDYFDPSKGTLKLLWEEEWRGLGITQVRLT